jgi:hypothetical protein
MAIHKYVSCARCRGIGVIAIHPREEWTPDMEKHFVVCPVCNGLGRVREQAETPPKKKDAASE